MSTVTEDIERPRIHHKRDRLRQLRTFCHAARFKSFAKAAVQLGISPPAVSSQVRELEYELEARLFERNAASISLTAAGETLYAITEPLVQGMDALSDAVHRESITEGVSGRFELAATMVAASFVLPSCIKRFRDRYPKIRVRVRNCPFREGMRLLLDHEVELMIGAKDVYPRESVEYHPLLSYDMVLITPLDHPLAGRGTVPPEEAVEWPVIVPPAGIYTREFDETIAERSGAERKVAIEVGGWERMKRYVERGFGISMVPGICVSPTDRLSVISLGDHSPGSSFGLFTRRDSILDPLAGRFVGFMSTDFLSSFGTGRDGDDMSDVGMHVRHLGGGRGDAG